MQNSKQRARNLEAHGQPSLFSGNHKDPSSVEQRAMGRKAFGSVQHRVLLAITFGYYVLLTGNPNLGAVGVCRVYDSWLSNQLVPFARDCPSFSTERPLSRKAPQSWAHRAG